MSRRFQAGDLIMHMERDKSYFGLIMQVRVYQAADYIVMWFLQGCDDEPYLVLRSEADLRRCKKKG